MEDNRQHGPDAVGRILAERYLLGGTLPEAIATNIISDGLPDALRARPTGVYNSPEVPLDLSETQRTQLLTLLGEVRDEALLDAITPPDEPPDITRR